MIARSLLALLALSAFRVPAVAEEQITTGQKYEIVRPVFLMAVYDSLEDKRSKKPPTKAYIYPERYAETRWVAFQRRIPPGVVMTIAGAAPPAKDLWYRYPAYYVRLQPDQEESLDIIVQLFRGFDDRRGGLNPRYFRLIDEPLGISLPEPSKNDQR